MWVLFFSQASLIGCFAIELAKIALLQLLIPATSTVNQNMLPMMQHCEQSSTPPNNIVGPINLPRLASINQQRHHFCCWTRFAVVVTKCFHHINSLFLSIGSLVQHGKFLMLCSHNRASSHHTIDRQCIEFVTFCCAHFNCFYLSIKSDANENQK